MHLDLESLSLFAYAAETGSLTKAAKHSYLSLAAASRRIAVLEESFQTQLLNRTSRGVEPTAAGKVLLDHTRELLLGANRLQSEMNEYAKGRKGLIRILATTSAITYYLPQDLAEFSKTYFDARLSIGEAWSDEIARRIQDRKADLGIVVAGCETGELALRPYRTYRIGVVCRPDHPLVSGASVSYTDVLDHNVVSLESESQMMHTLFEHAVLANKPLALRVQVRSFEAICRLVQAGLGVGLLPGEPATELAREMGLVIRPLADSWAERQMLVCFRTGKEKSKLLSSLVDHLTKSRDHL